MPRRSNPPPGNPFGAPALLASPLRNLLAGTIYMFCVMLAATVAYEAAGWSLGDAIYMVVLTVYTVGYEEVRTVDTPLLRMITITLIVLGCTGMIFLTGVLVQLITASQLQQLLGVKRMQNQIDRLNNHVIVCGFGRIGQTLARQLDDGQAQFLVVERSEAHLAAARELGYICLHADATDEAALTAAGVERARCLATVLPDDAANVFITLSARSLNRSLVIIARGEFPTTEVRLLQAGANTVVMPTHIGAERIAELILYPDAAQFLHGSESKEQFVRDLRLLGLNIEVVSVGEGSPCIGRTVSEIEKEGVGGFLIVGLNRRDGENIQRPAGGVLVAAGDGVMVVTRPGEARKIDELFHKRWSRSARR